VTVIELSDRYLYAPDKPLATIIMIYFCPFLFAPLPYVASSKSGIAHLVFPASEPYAASGHSSHADPAQVVTWLVDYCYANGIFWAGGTGASLPPRRFTSPLQRFRDLH
jgi:hypothetical protein